MPGGGVASRRKMLDAGVRASLVKGIRGRDLLATITTLAQAPPEEPTTGPPNP